MIGQSENRPTTHPEGFVLQRFASAFPGERTLWLLDLGLAASALLMLVTDAVVLFFHVVFVLLALGAFYWKLRSFVLRATVWISITAAVVMTAILAGETQTEEIVEIPMLSLILVLVFAIAQQRSRAEESLRATNEELEDRITKRTADLTRLNGELMDEIAQRRLAEATLRDSEERYRHLVELSFEAIAIHDYSRLVYVNPAGANLLGAEHPDQLVDRPIRDFVHPSQWHLVQSRVQKVRDTGKGVPPAEEKFFRLDGTVVDVEVVAIPITYRSQPAVQVVIRDISARKRAELERERERARIARDLHDTLGQSLGYLHLKLDQFAGDAAVGPIDGVAAELAQMRDAANAAYELVRNMLAAELPSNNNDLASALLVQARAMGRRNGFEVRMNAEGCPTSLPPVTRQQILYLFREALTNVGRHANAQNVDIDLLWTTEQLTIILLDDGHGFARSKPSTSRNVQFGLKIMYDRAAELNGKLSFVSRPGEGTQVTLQVPLDHGSQP